MSSCAIWQLAGSQNGKIEKAYCYARLNDGISLLFNFLNITQSNVKTLIPILFLFALHEWWQRCAPPSILSPESPGREQSVIRKEEIYAKGILTLYQPWFVQLGCKMPEFCLNVARCSRVGILAQFGKITTAITPQPSVAHLTRITGVVLVVCPSYYRAYWARKKHVEHAGWQRRYILFNDRCKRVGRRSKSKLKNDGRVLAFTMAFLAFINTNNCSLLWGFTCCSRC